MKFKDKDGNVFEDVVAFRGSFCCDYGTDNFGNCVSCPIWQAGKTKLCEKWISEHPYEAARLMGYEVVEDDKHWIDNADSYICPDCGFETSNPAKYSECKCPVCGFRDTKPKPRKCDRCGREFIADYPQYLCPECDEALEKQCTPVKKPLKDWTLGEIKEYCSAENRDCKTCFIISEKDDRCRLWNDEFASPCSWDLTDPTRFTEQEVADAKALIRLHKEKFDSIRRTEGVLLLMNNDQWAGSINTSAFPSIAQGETVKLSEIVGGTE